MAKLSFLWHLHQPSYRTADGVSHAPWAMMHAGGAYRTLAAAIAETGGRGQVVNIVPTLLEQLLAYREHTVERPGGRGFDHPRRRSLRRPTRTPGLVGLPRHPETVEDGTRDWPNSPADASSPTGDPNSRPRSAPAISATSRCSSSSPRRVSRRGGTIASGGFGRKGAVSHPPITKPSPPGSKPSPGS